MNHNLLLLLFFFFFFVLLFNAAFSDYLSPDSCKPQTCGGLQNITYPFWVEQSQPSYCGVPNFKLSCTDDKAVLNVSGDAYYVQKIFYNNRSVLLSNTQFFNGSDCAPRHNLTFSPPFRLNPSNTYIHLFEGCGSSLTGSLGLTPICSGVIAVPYDYHGSFNYTKLVGECNYSVVAPVWSLDNEEGIHDYLQILKDGFLLNWNTSTCIDECLQRGGRCGYDTATNNAVCLCEDRVHFKKCKARSVSSGNIVLPIFLLLLDLQLSYIINWSYFW
ncbi:hypothetical protein QJS04_geneDACA003064 [Acorus gramineus]|uniref:Uncharacterized protein n=1 Tax=Acorus gramineus TaxID=55184 RepID=A0AAV9BZB6_ACOGR|nr:hypothetical protein QJS04_geneDACA003064 [Acorus gramineus]